MIVLYGHLSCCLRSIKVVSAELALGRRCDEFINSWYRHVQGFLAIGVTARCCVAQRRAEVFIPAHFKRQGRVSQSTLRHPTWKLSNFMTVQRRLIFSPSSQIITQLLHSSEIIIDHLYQDYS